jgi:hypothetical protein
LAWVVIKNKNNDSWRYFFKHLIALILKIKEEETVFISDYGKGLKAANNKLKDYVIKAIILII